MEDPTALLLESEEFDWRWYGPHYLGFEAPQELCVRDFLATDRVLARDPNARFSSAFYYESNPDVARSEWNGFAHYLLHGRQEGRSSSRGVPVQALASSARHDFEDWLATDTHAHGFMNNRRVVLELGEFDADWYASHYPAERISSNHSLQNFLTRPRDAPTDPNPFFDSSYYLATNPDVASSDFHPYVHYLMHGRLEGRAPAHPAALGSPFKQLLDDEVAQRCARRWSHPAPSEAFAPAPPLFLIDDDLDAAHWIARWDGPVVRIRFGGGAGPYPALDASSAVAALAAFSAHPGSIFLAAGAGARGMSPGLLLALAQALPPGSPAAMVGAQCLDGAMQPSAGALIRADASAELRLAPPLAVMRAAAGGDQPAQLAADALTSSVFACRTYLLDEEVFRQVRSAWELALALSLKAEQMRRPVRCRPDLMVCDPTPCRLSSAFAAHTDGLTRQAGTLVGAA